MSAVGQTQGTGGSESGSSSGTRWVKATGGLSGGTGGTGAPQLVGSGGTLGTSVCGNGVLEASEVCDDGNAQSGDGCSLDCSREPGADVCVPGRPCTADPDCGNGVRDDGEECDPGADASVDWDGGYPRCTRFCTLAGFCGDGVVQPEHGEACDVGVNAGGYGGCNPDCSLGPHCGDGVVQRPNGEECDLGDDNGAPLYSCTSKCMLYLFP